MKRVSIVILTYNSQNDIVPCLKSLLADNTPEKEILIIDNASRDRSVEIVRRMFPQVRVIENATNRGVAAGWNQGWRATTGEFVVFINPDTEMAPDWLEQIKAAFAEYEEADVIGIKLLYPDGKTIQHGGLYFHPNAQSYHRAAHEEDRGQVDTIEPVPAVTGAVLAVRRSALECFGGFDEDYFPAYFEEADLCYRVNAAGRKVLYVPTAVAVHHESATLGTESAAYVRLYFRMRALYILKNYSLGYILKQSIPYELRIMRHWPPMHRKYALLSWISAFPFLVRRIWNKLLRRPGRPYGWRARGQHAKE